MFYAHKLLASMQPRTQVYLDCMAAIKFDLGELDDVYDLSDLSSGEFFEIPAPICLFQITLGTDVYLFLAKRDCGGVVWRMFLRNANTGHRWDWVDLEWFTEPDGKTMFTSRISDNHVYGKFVDGLFVNDKFGDLEPDQQWALVKMIIVAKAIEVFSCSNVGTEEHKPSRALNSSRKSAGKVPFFTYHTLVIKTNSQAVKSGARGGSHASPRLHLRRGHIRKLQDGRRIWITQCLVGDKTKGIVQKEYMVG